MLNIALIYNTHYIQWVKFAEQRRMTVILGTLYWYMAVYT